MLVRSGEPLRILVELILCRSHNVEGNYRHQPVWGDGTGIGGAVVGCSYKGINKINRIKGFLSK